MIGEGAAHLRFVRLLSLSNEADSGYPLEVLVLCPEGRVVGTRGSVNDTVGQRQLVGETLDCGGHREIGVEIHDSSLAHEGDRLKRVAGCQT